MPALRMRACLLSMLCSRDMICMNALLPLKYRNEPLQSHMHPTIAWFVTSDLDSYKLKHSLALVNRADCPEGCRNDKGEICCAVSHCQDGCLHRSPAELCATKANGGPKLTLALSHAGIVEGEFLPIPHSPCGIEGDGEATPACHDLSLAVRVAAVTDPTGEVALHVRDK